MNLLPNQKLTLLSKLSKEEAIRMITENTEAEKSFELGRTNHYTKPFVGFVAGNQFRVFRAIGYRNSFLPHISGEILEGAFETRVHVSMQMNRFVRVFMMVWLAGVSLAILTIIYSNYKTGFTASMLITPLMLAVGIGMMYGGFYFESKRSIDALTALFHAKNYKQINITV